jgi:hypothetical protein
LEATIQEFLDWKNSAQEQVVSQLNSFKDYDINDYWAYADYKYMISMKKEGLINEWVLGALNQ